MGQIATLGVRQRLGLPASPNLGCDLGAAKQLAPDRGVSAGRGWGRAKGEDLGMSSYLSTSNDYELYLSSRPLSVRWIALYLAPDRVYPNGRWGRM